MRRYLGFTKISDWFFRLKKSTRVVLILFILSVFITSLFTVLYNPRTYAATFITSGTTWNVPSDWVSTNNTIEVFGGGGGGGGGFQESTGNGGLGGGGGGGGGYTKSINVTLTPGSTVGISIGAAGTGGASSANGTAGGDAYICNDTANCASIAGGAVVVGAKGGGLGLGGTTLAAGTGGAGGASASGVGNSTKYNGGTGGTGGASAASSGGGGGGGAGAAGLNAAGNNGTGGTNDIHGNGGQGDGSFGGAGATTSGAAGSNGTEFTTHGSGGGAAGGDGSKTGTGAAGGLAGTYSAGGGAGGGNGKAANLGGAGGAGKQGFIRITYSLEIQVSYRWRLDDGNETSGTSLAAQNTTASINYGTNVRLRMVVADKGDTTSFNYQVEYAPYQNGCGTWTTVPNTATTEHFNMYDTANYVDQAASTNTASGSGVITDPSGYSFVAGNLVESPSNSAVITLSAGQFTEIEYAVQANSNATLNAYCFRVTNAGADLDQYDNYPIININYPPSTPTIYSVLDGTTNASRLPTFQIKSTDLNSDYLRYVVELCTLNSWPCTSGAITYNQTSSQTCWNSQNSQTATAYASTGILASSTTAYCQVPVADLLTPNTTYYMRTKATDPGGSATYSPYSSVVTFSTSILDIMINGGSSITGGTQIGN